MRDYYIIFGLILAFVFGGLEFANWYARREQAKSKDR